MCATWKEKKKTTPTFYFLKKPETSITIISLFGIPTLTVTKVKMVSSEGDGGGDKLMRKVLGLGYWVQGFRCFPWLVVSFFLKDGLNVNPTTLQILQSSASIPMVGKPIYGLVSDSVYISGQHRLPYIAFGGNITSTL